MRSEGAAGKGRGEGWAVRGTSSRYRARPGGCREAVPPPSSRGARWEGVASSQGAAGRCWWEPALPPRPGAALLGRKRGRRLGPGGSHLPTAEGFGLGLETGGSSADSRGRPGPPSAGPGRSPQRWWRTKGGSGTRGGESLIVKRVSQWPLEES